MDTLIKIAKRVPPGDRWVLLSDNTGGSFGILEGITEVLEAYFHKTSYVGNYHIAPRDDGGAIYIIEHRADEAPPRRLYDIYNEKVYD